MTKTVLILPGCTDTNAVEMFKSRGWNAFIFDGAPGEMNDYKPDAICFMGGTDVDPAIYGEERGETTQTPNKARDAFEVAVYERFKDTDVYLFGICRGAQLLNVLNGGKMIQECGYRGGTQDIIVSDALEEALGLEPVVTKHGRQPHYVKHDVCHHQGILVGPEADQELIYGFTSHPNHEDALDYMIHYPKTQSFGVQGHPEWGHKQTEDLFFAGINLVMEGN